METRTPNGAMSRLEGGRKGFWVYTLVSSVRDLRWKGVSSVGTRVLTERLLLLVGLCVVGKRRSHTVTSPGEVSSLCFPCIFFLKNIIIYMCIA